jgi:hypothetical protein
MIHGLRQRRFARPEATQALASSRADDVSENGPETLQSTRERTDEWALKITILEAEILALRQLLAEVRANREDLRQEMDDLRRERDHWRGLAKSREAEQPATRTWFCGRALPDNQG